MTQILNLWNKVLDWVQDRNDRKTVIRNFNDSAKEAFINCIVPVLLKAKISKGNPSYRHNFSWSGSSGFRIEAMSGRQMTKDEIITLGDTILSDTVLVRRLVANGWDTLEIHSDVGMYGCRWQLKEFIAIGG